MKDQFITIRITEVEKTALERLKKQTGLTMTEIVRLGISKITADDLPTTRIE